MNEFSDAIYKAAGDLLEFTRKHPESEPRNHDLWNGINFSVSVLGGDHELEVEIRFTVDQFNKYNYLGEIFDIIDDACSMYLGEIWNDDVNAMEFSYSWGELKECGEIEDGEKEDIVIVKGRITDWVS
jgi:hypothetical protein